MTLVTFLQHINLRTLFDKVLVTAYLLHNTVKYLRKTYFKNIVLLKLDAVVLPEKLVIFANIR